MIRYLHRIALVLASALVTSAAFVQPQITGSVTGVVDGEERGWSTYADTFGDQFINSASWIQPLAGMDLTSITILAQTEPAVLSTTVGGLMIGIESFTLPQDCPCSFENVEIFYFTSARLLEDFYVTNDATLTLDSFVVLDDDTYQATGSFQGTLEFRESAMVQPDPNNTVEVSGSFEIERLSREPAE